MPNGTPKPLRFAQLLARFAVVPVLFLSSATAADPGPPSASASPLPLRQAILSPSSPINPQLRDTCSLASSPSPLGCPPSPHLALRPTHFAAANWTPAGEPLPGDSPAPQSGDGAPRPSISGTIVDGFNFAPRLAPNTWLTLFGTNFSTETRNWDGAIQGTRLPTSLAGLSVTVNNRPAIIYFVSPGQINLLTPNDIGTGDMNVIVRNNNGESNPAIARASPFAPAFYSPFAQNGRFFVTAVSLTGEYVGSTVDPRVRRAARPGEILQIYGTGFGPTDPALPVDQIVIGAPRLTTPLRIRFGDVVATFAAPGNLVAAGLYQFNVTVPDVLPDGEYPLIAEIGGFTSPTNVFLRVQR